MFYVANVFTNISLIIFIFGRTRPSNFDVSRTTNMKQILVNHARPSWIKVFWSEK